MEHFTVMVKLVYVWNTWQVDLVVCIRLTGIFFIQKRNENPMCMLEVLCCTCKFLEKNIYGSQIRNSGLHTLYHSVLNFCQS